MAKLKSLKETPWTRLRAFLRGLLLYNTVYWRRASDGVDRSASRVGKAERAKSRPQVNPELLRPRARPGGETPRPGAGGSPDAAAGPTGSNVPSPARLAVPAIGEGWFGIHHPDAADDDGQRGTHARRKRRVVRRRELRDKAVDPGRVLRNRGDARPKRPLPGWLRWLIGWHR